MAVFPLMVLLGARLRRGFAKKATATLMLFIITANFSACWDRVEIENRAFVVAMGIDKYENGYELSLTVPIMHKDIDDEEEEFVKTAQGRTILEAYRKLDSETDRILYLGQAKVIVLGDTLLRDEKLLNAAITALENFHELDRKTQVLVAKETAAEVLKESPSGETLPGLYIAEIFRTQKKASGRSFSYNLETFFNDMRDRNGAIIPQINAEDSRLVLSCAAVLKNRTKIGCLSAEEYAIRGFLWTKPQGCLGAVLTIEQHDAMPESFQVERHTAKTIFKEKDGKLHAYIIVETTLKDLANHPNKKALSAELERKIADEILTTASKIQSEHNFDAYNWLETLRKHHNKLYKKYVAAWDSAFSQVEISVDVSVS